MKPNLPCSSGFIRIVMRAGCPWVGDSSINKLKRRFLIFPLPVLDVDDGDVGDTGEGIPGDEDESGGMGEVSSCRSNEGSLLKFIGPLLSM